MVPSSPLSQSSSSPADVKSAKQPWRLRKHADYQRVYKSSRKQQSSSMSWFAAARAESDLWPQPRVGLTAGRVLGKAVERNRIKRRMREAVKAGLPLLPSNADVILHPRRNVLDVEFAVLKREVAKIFTLVRDRMGNAPRSPQ